MFVKFSAFGELPETTKASLLSALNPEALTAIRQSLAPLAAVAPNHPLAFLGNMDATPKQKERLPELLREFYDCNGRASVLSMALGYELGIDQGKIHVAAHLVDDLIGRFNAIGLYPETEEASRAAGAFRAAASTLFMTMKLDGSGLEHDASWVEAFWERISGFGAGLFPDTIEDENTDSEDPFEQFVFAFRAPVRPINRYRPSPSPYRPGGFAAFTAVADNRP